VRRELTKIEIVSNRVCLNAKFLCGLLDREILVVVRLFEGFDLIHDDCNISDIISLVKKIFCFVLTRSS